MACAACDIPLVVGSEADLSAPNPPIAPRPLTPGVHFDWRLADGAHHQERQTRGRAHAPIYTPFQTQTKWITVAVTSVSSAACL